MTPLVCILKSKSEPKEQTLMSLDETCTPSFSTTGAAVSDMFTSEDTRKQPDSYAESVYVCDLSDFNSISRKRVTVQGRDIFIVKVRGQYFALDSFCYHAGGPLHEGQIEDIGQWTCVRCPWHNYNICVDSGEGLYESIDPFNMNKPPETKSKGVKQRTHTVTVDNGKIFVQLSDIDTVVESDYYNCKEYREKYALR